MGVSGFPMRCAKLSGACPCLCPCGLSSAEVHWIAVRHGLSGAIPWAVVTIDDVRGSAARHRQVATHLPKQFRTDFQKNRIFPTDSSALVIVSSTVILSNRAVLDQRLMAGQPP